MPVFFFLMNYSNFKLITYCDWFRFGGEEQQEENRVHLGNAIMSFYSALIDLLGRCAPEMHVSEI